MVDGQRIPLASYTASASPPEITLLERFMQDIAVPKGVPGRPKTRPKQVIGDKAYDNNSLRKRLKQGGVRLLSPHRRNHRDVNRQDDRLWDRCRRRYIVERTFACLGNYRGLVLRYQNHITIFIVFVELSIAILTLKNCLYGFAITSRPRAKTGGALWRNRLRNLELSPNIITYRQEESDQGADMVPAARGSAKTIKEMPHMATRVLTKLVAQNQTQHNPILLIDAHHRFPQNIDPIPFSIPIEPAKSPKLTTIFGNAQERQYIVSTHSRLNSSEHSSLVNIPPCDGKQQDISAPSHPHPKRMTHRLRGAR